MKHITKILAMGFALGLALAATTANAGNPIACNKEWVGAKNKTCTDPDTGTKVTVDADADATAIAAALANANANATGGSASATGGNVTYNEAETPRFTGRAELVAKIEISVLNGQHARNVVMLSEREEKLGNKCLAQAVLEDHPAMKRTLKRAGVGFTMCGTD